MIEFVKMHGIGNDYVYIDAARFPIDDPAGLAISMSDRHTGIGSDGLILLLPPTDDTVADLRMRMFNADGSESEMCGNGIRCVCKLAHDDGLVRSNPMRIETGAGVLSLGYRVEDSEVAMVTVDMGKPVLSPCAIPMRLDREQPVIDDALDDLVDWDAIDDGWMASSGLCRRMTCVSMGNPHAVIAVLDRARVPLERFGPWLETHALFPQRTNVHVVEFESPGHIHMQTWERGSGITRACGTGACAVAVMGVLTGRSERAVQVNLPGGPLQVEWDESTGHVLMAGTATEVFRGVWPAKVPVT